MRLPHTLKLFASDCAGKDWDSPYYNPALHAINMCYSFFAASNKDADYLLDLQAKGKLWTPVSREQYVAGLFTSVLMHETGHALFDQLDIPVFGREEDGADEVAAFLALQFNKETARTIIKGFAYTWALSGDPRTQAALQHAVHRLWRRSRDVPGLRRFGLAAAGTRQELRQGIPADQICLRKDDPAVRRSGADGEGARAAMVYPGRAAGEVSPTAAPSAFKILAIL